MATRASILAWEIVQTEEPDGLHSPSGHKELATAEHTRTGVYQAKDLAIMLIPN